MDMAKKYHLQVIIDLHGLKGSQNGYDHSGRIGKANWHKNSQYQQESLATLEAIAKRYKGYDNFWGLQIINEPKIGILQLTLRRFYKEAYRRLDKILQPHTRIIFSDGFTPRLLSGALRHGSRRAVMDVHLYHMTTLFSKFLSIEWFMKKTIRRAHLLKRLSKAQPLIVGEWSGVMRHETMRHLSWDQQEALVRSYTKLQIDTYDNVAGWFYWSYKTEAPGAWNFRTQVEDGTIDLQNK
jgi:glucan 1,3-beta-glucosidase